MPTDGCKEAGCNGVFDERHRGKVSPVDIGDDGKITEGGITAADGARKRHPGATYRRQTGPEFCGEATGTFCFANDSGW